MTMYLPNRDVRPTGYEAGEFIEPPPTVPGTEASSAPTPTDDEDDEPGDLHVDPTVAHEVAHAYLDAGDRHDPLAVAAFARLMTETDELFRRMTCPGVSGALRVFFTTCDTPYCDAEELIASVTNLSTLEVTTVAADRDRRHPLMSNDLGGDYDRFRAVHDAVGHARTRRGFDRDGEFVAWRTQERFHSPLARRALATELHGQHSVRWTTGDAARPKVFLLEAALVRRAQHEESHS